MKSASFGYTLKVKWNGWTSPDLSCPVQGAQSILGSATMAIINRLDLRIPAPTTAHPTRSPKPDR